VSIVRVGLSETQKFAEGYDAIFGKKGGKSAPAKKAAARKRAAKQAPAKKKGAAEGGAKRATKSARKK
jgi:DNA topoisomerase-1